MISLNKQTKLCLECGGRMEIVEGEISPAYQNGGDIEDSEWGSWWECENGHQEDIEKPEIEEELIN